MLFVSDGSSGPSQTKATLRPSSLIAGSWQLEWLGSPAAPFARLTSVIAPVVVSCT